MYTRSWNLTTESYLSQIKNDDYTYITVNGSSVERTIEAIMLSIISITALVGNVSLCLVVIKTRSLHTASNALVVCLATADILVATFNMPMMIVTLATGAWVFSNEACVAMGFIGMTLLIASVLSLAAISVNRYQVICSVVRYQQKKFTTTMITGVWTFSLLLASPPLFGWAEYGYLPLQNVCFCLWTTSVSYTFFMVGMCFGVPCVVMSCCYIRVFLTVRKSSRRVESMTERMEKQSTIHISTIDNRLTVPGNQLQLEDMASNIHHGDISVIDDFETTMIPRRMPLENESLTPCDARISEFEVMRHKTRKKAQKKREEIRFTLSLVIVVFIFIICWLPYCIEMFYSVFSNHPTARQVAIVTQLLGYLNSGVNPILYGVLNKRFRDGYSKLYRPLLNRCHKSTS